MNQIIQRMRLDSFQLKWIAIVTMAADHIGAVLFSRQIWLRAVGRVSFPIFCFLLVEGYFHTSNIYRYMIRLGIFALISEIPYDLAFRGVILEFSHQNVFFTLLLGLILLYALEKTREWPVKVLDLILVMWFAQILHTDYGYKGILLIFIFCIFREKIWPEMICGVFWNFLSLAAIQRWGALSMAPIALYSGEQGRKMKYFFYVFYPAHLLVLYCVAKYMSIW